MPRFKTVLRVLHSLLERPLAAIYAPGSIMISLYQRHPEFYRALWIRVLGGLAMGLPPVIAMSLYGHVLLSRKDQEKLSRSMNREYHFHQALMATYTFGSLTFSFSDILRGLDSKGEDRELEYLLPCMLPALIVTTMSYLTDETASEKPLLRQKRGCIASLEQKLNQFINKLPSPVLKWSPVLSTGLVYGSLAVSALEIHDAIYHEKRDISYELQFLCGGALFLATAPIKAYFIANAEKLDQALKQETGFNRFLRSFLGKEHLNSKKLFHYMTELCKAALVCEFGLLALDGTIHGNRNSNEWLPPTSHIVGLTILAVTTAIFGFRKLPVSPKATLAETSPGEHTRLLERFTLFRRGTKPQPAQELQTLPAPDGATLLPTVALSQSTDNHLRA